MKENNPNKDIEKMKFKNQQTYFNNFFNNQNGKSTQSPLHIKTP